MGQRLNRQGQPCPSCTSSDAYFLYSNGGYCFSCSYRGSEKITAEYNKNETTKSRPITLEEYEDRFSYVLPNAEREYLNKYYIDQHTQREFHIAYAYNMRRLILPHFVDNLCSDYAARSVNPEVKPKVLHFGNKSPMITARHPGKPYVIVEDFLSAVRVAEYVNTVCLFGTKLKADTKLKSVLLGHTAVLWLDSDRAGQRAAREIQVSSGLLTFENIITPEDPKYYTREEILKILETYVCRI